MSVKNCFLKRFTLPPLIIFLKPLLWWFLKPGGSIDQNWIPNSLLSVRWPVSMIIVLYYRKKLLWWVLRVVLICGYKDKTLGVSLLPYPFSRIIILGFPLGSMSMWPQNFGPANTPRDKFHLLYGEGFKSNHKVVSHSHISASIAPAGIPCQASHCYSLQFSQLGETKTYYFIKYVKALYKVTGIELRWEV